MRGARGWTTLGAVALAVALVSGWLGSRRWAAAHVEHYTGTAPAALSCASCHFDAMGGTLRDRVLRPRYRSPLDIAVAPDGARLYVTARDGGDLLVVDPAARKLLAAIPAGRRPHGVVLDREGRLGFVTDSDAGVVSVIDLERRAAVARLPAGNGPAGIVLAADGATLFVANALGGDVSVIDVATGAEKSRIGAGSYPYAAAASPDGSRVVVTNLLAAARPGAGTPVSEVTVLDARSGRVVTRWMLPNAHLLEGVAYAPRGDLALVTLVRPKNLVPALQVERGWMMTNGFGVIDLARGRAAQLPLDEAEECYADPSDVAVTPDGRYAFVSHGGVDAVSVIDLEAVRELLAGSSEADLAGFANRLALGRRYVRKRIATGANPRGLAVSPDGRYVYVAERLDDTLGVIDVARLERVATIDLQGPRHETLVRRGEKVFNSARATLQHQFSCRSCHPDNHVDRLQYDFEPDGLGRNIVDNRTLLGLRGTEPFKWNGRNTSLYMQCGIRFARFLTRSAPFPFRDQVALAAFLQSLEPPANRRVARDGALDEAQERGRAIFERGTTRSGQPISSGNRCVTCHAPEHYTDRLKHDVGSASASDGERAFDTPQLRSLEMSAPFLHDGKAATLEEIWTLYSPNDEHGVTSDLGKQGLNDLVEYLKTL